MIRVKIGAIYHYGIFVSENEIIQFGEPPVGSLLARDYSSVKVCTATADEFSCGNIIEVAELDRKEKRKRFSPDKTIEIARSRIGEGGYNLIHNNCEHFVFECVFGIRKSTQEDEARERWRNRPITALYLANVPDDVEITALYPRRRNAEINHTQNEAARAEKYYVWKLLGYAVRDSFGKELKDCSPKKSRCGKWTCDGVWFSLAHSCGTVAVAVSNAEIGIDIENIGMIRDKYTKEQILKLSDKLGVTQDPEMGDAYMNFLNEWTRKESIFKRLGKGHFSPSGISADEPYTYSGVLDVTPKIYLAFSGKNSASASIYFCEKPGEKSLVNDKFTESIK